MAKGTIIGGGSYLTGGVQHFVLSQVDLDVEGEPEAALVDVAFLVHGVSIDPNDRTRAACFEKHGPGACLVNLAEQKALQAIPTPSNRHFYGHGSFSRDGSLLYATESYLDDDRRGALIVRDATTLEELGELPTYGTAPHDCVLIDDGAVMVVTNGGGPLRGGAKPSITFVDLKDERLLERIELGQGRYNAGHLAITSAGDIALVSAPREGLPSGSRDSTGPNSRGPNSRGLGAVSLKPKGKPIVTMRKPKNVVERMKGETLSVAVHEPTGHVMATHPDGDMLTRWDLLTGTLLKRYDDFEGPNGVCLTLDEAHFVVSHVHEGRAGLSYVDATSTTQVPEIAASNAMISGSHLFVHEGFQGAR